MIINLCFSGDGHTMKESLEGDSLIPLFTWLGVATKEVLFDFFLSFLDLLTFLLPVLSMPPCSNSELNDSLKPFDSVFGGSRDFNTEF